MAFLDRFDCFDFFFFYIHHLNRNDLMNTAKDNFTKNGIQWDRFSLFIDLLCRAVFWQIQSIQHINAIW